jgi:hypothetical protein
VFLFPLKYFVVGFWDTPKTYGITGICLNARSDSWWKFHRRQSRVHNTQQWLAISASSHRTKAIGQDDGYSIILLPKVSSSQDPDLDIDADPKRTASEAQGMEPTMSSGEKHFAGLQECMCFEHVDSVIYS